MPGKYVELNEQLYTYLVAQRSGVADPVLDALRTETETLGTISQMSISPEQASLFTLLVAAIGAKGAVEVGTFTGTSSISIARGLAPGGKLTCFDISEEYTSIARRYWAKAGIADRIELRLGPGADLLKQFQPPAPLDFAFIDADKEGYDTYYELILPLMRPGGLLIFDNMLQHGRIIDPPDKLTDSAKAIDQLNRKLTADPRVQGVLIPVADGLYLCRKL
jgi:caffeoyl-CoA O-methyltransferase